MSACAHGQDRSVHLVVLVHGFHGFASDLVHVERAIVARCSKCPGTRTRVYRTRVNEWRTHDGIANGGRRVHEDIVRLLDTSSGQVRFLSLVGHSLGGVYCRQAAWLLHDSGILAQRRVSLLNFATLASPHLGIRRDQTRSLFNFLFVRGAVLLSRTSKELALQDAASPDKAPMLQVLASPGPLAALAAFKRRTLYANVFYDMQVPFSTASIRARNPHRGKAVLPASEAFPHILQSSVDTLTASPDGTVVADDCATAFRHDSKKVVLRQMLKALQSLAWRRVAVHFGSPLAHEQIAAKRRGAHDVFMKHSCGDVVRHLASQLVLPPHQDEEESKGGDPGKKKRKQQGPHYGMTTRKKKKAHKNSPAAGTGVRAERDESQNE